MCNDFQELHFIVEMIESIVDHVSQFVGASLLPNLRSEFSCEYVPATKMNGCIEKG